MPFSIRVACLATMTFATAFLDSSGTPGFAKEASETINVATALSVPVSGDGTTAVPIVAVPAPAINVVGMQPTDIVAFGTLAAAVAAQPLPDAMGEDLSCMAGAIYFEAKGEPLAGQLAVGEVIRNRARSGRFPKSVCSVVMQPGQFSFVRGGRMPAIARNRAYQTAVAVARVAIGEMWESPAAGAMYFHARRVAPAWGHAAVATIGNHIFYR